MILYEVLNEVPHALAERTYAVWPDLEALMREHGDPQFTVDAHRAVGDLTERATTSAGSPSPQEGSRLSLLPSMGEAVGVGAVFDDGAVVGGAVRDCGAEAGSVEVSVQPEKDWLEAIAMEVFSSRSVRTWKRSSAPRRSSSL